MMAKRRLQADKSSKTDAEKSEKLNTLIKKYNAAMEENNPEHHRLCREIAEMHHQMKYEKDSLPRNWRDRWKDRLRKILKGGEKNDWTV